MCSGIYSGSSFVVVLSEDDELFVWGNNKYGELGVGKGDSTVKLPTRLHFPKDEPVTEVACGCSHSIALTTSGAVYFWGGMCHEEIHWTPTEVFQDDELDRSKVISVACGGDSCFALRSDGRILAWGLGFGSISQPVQVTVNTHITKVMLIRSG